MTSIVKNRKAFHDYFIEDQYEAGLILQGTEIKSLREGKVQIKDAHITFIDGEAFIKGMHIAKYDLGNRFNHEEDRDRKLLLHKHEIAKMQKAVQLQGYTIVPLGIHLSKGRAKLKIAEAKGKHLYDKRHVERERSMQRDIQKAMKNNY